MVATNPQHLLEHALLVLGEWHPDPHERRSSLSTSG